MPNDLIATDPLISQNFFLEIDGEVVTILSSVSGLDIEVDVASIQQVGKMGKIQMIRTLGNQVKAPDLTLTRMAPADSANDKMWKWFNDIRDKGMKVADRAGVRKNGSIVIYDYENKEVLRWNFVNGWISKLQGPSLNAGGNDVAIEAITIVHEGLTRIK